MKRLALLLVVLVLLSACGRTGTMAETTTEATTATKIVNDDGIRAFSYEQEVEISFANAADGWGVATEGFQNVTECIVSGKDDAIRLAKNEVTIVYSEASVAYDDTCDMWMITLFNFDSGYPVTTIYLTGKGITTLIASH